MGTVFAEQVRRARQAAWMTQEELAERSGLSPRTIQAIERGQVSRPHRESVRLLAKALDLHGSARVGFEAAARRGADREPGCDCAADPCPTLAAAAGCLTRRLRRTDLRVDLRGLGHCADAATVLDRLLRAAGIDPADGYDGFTGSPVSDHTLPVQMLPGA
ncbi:MAG TPA: helix-turn-helix transcriptional regulator [Actinophytocola sp.]|uniref:helix-turn-helix domain-containing protein n=1 Tax=Actinophytocola sp. TaxID=1872138 RepID=UPI002DBC354C|nr:helix-turn-helix transcriptional regulator [Actinophytocola sp.]HEU5472622.1 helix-turn-helix transcriptional regulator [Actinophytocola sp.]